MPKGLFQLWIPDPEGGGETVACDGTMEQCIGYAFTHGIRGSLELYNVDSDKSYHVQIEISWWVSRGECKLQW